MLYNVLGNVGNWESDVLGLLQTIETFPDNIHSALGVVAQQKWDEWFTGECPLHSGRSIAGNCMDIFEEFELSAYYEGEAIAGLVVTSGNDELILVLVPAKLTVI